MADYDKEKAQAHSDSISPIEFEGVEGSRTLKRQLKARHVAMIRSVFRAASCFRSVLNTVYSIGGVIGTGLFLGTGGVLKSGGPVGYAPCIHVAPSVILTVPLASYSATRSWAPYATQ